MDRARRKYLIDGGRLGEINPRLSRDQPQVQGDLRTRIDHLPQGLRSDRRQVKESETTYIPLLAR